MIDKKICVSIFLIVGLLLSTIIWAQSSKDNKVDAALFSEQPEKLSKGIVVLELFTSQGCSSCPPADELLQEVKMTYPDNVFALSYHVDYWNYIGWEDPFSKKEFTERQSSYNKKFGYNGNYTPELVVNGKEHLVGSHKAKVVNAIKKYSATTSESQILIKNFKRQENQIYFDYNIIGKTSAKTVRAVLLLKERNTQVNRGENRQKTLVNTNIVIAEKTIVINDDNPFGSLAVPSLVKEGEEFVLMLIVENARGDILSAVKKDF
ncbi:thioredoxin family protein [uncultured Maribacter sp.]|uniref:DUF1223 domain-containing protein n=1 Tax=uncultured Maribacter sp. TaxID=431308 RepID=UPI0026166136|nr:DUF1223 domain-containing protein [uncultured Maribacter sp.]